MTASPLFTPFTLIRLALPNRWVMPAMQRGMCEQGMPGAEPAATTAAAPRAGSR